MDTVSLDTFMLDVPLNEVHFFKQMVKQMGWHLHSKRTMTALEQSLDDERNGRVNHYANSEEFFDKMGIFCMETEKDCGNAIYSQTGC
jgi:hypothetical protein